MIIDTDRLVDENDFLGTSLDNAKKVIEPTEGDTGNNGVFIAQRNW